MSELANLQHNMTSLRMFFLKVFGEKLHGMPIRLHSEDGIYVWTLPAPVAEITRTQLLAIVQDPRVIKIQTRMVNNYIRFAIHTYAALSTRCPGCGNAVVECDCNVSTNFTCEACYRNGGGPEQCSTCRVVDFEERDSPFKKKEPDIVKIVAHFATPAKCDCEWLDCAESGRHLVGNCKNEAHTLIEFMGFSYSICNECLEHLTEHVEEEHQIKTEERPWYSNVRVVDGRKVVDCVLCGARNVDYEEHQRFWKHANS